MAAGAPTQAVPQLPSVSHSPGYLSPATLEPWAQQNLARSCPHDVSRLPAGAARLLQAPPRQRAHAAGGLPPRQLRRIQVCRGDGRLLVPPRGAHAGGAAQGDAHQVDGGAKRAVAGLLVALVGRHRLGAVKRKGGQVGGCGGEGSGSWRNGTLGVHSKNRWAGQAGSGGSSVCTRWAVPCRVTDQREVPHCPDNAPTPQLPYFPAAPHPGRPSS